MDPLSVSASIASLVSAAATVLRGLYMYTKVARGAEKQISALSMEITHLYGVLSSLQLIASRFESDVVELTDQERSMQINHVHACYNTLDSIRSLLVEHDPSMASSRMHSLRRRLHWPLSESRTKDFTNEVGRHKQTLALALNADTMAALLQSLSIQRGMADGIEDIRSRMLAGALSESRLKVLKSFSTNADPRRHLAAVLKLRQMGTGLWITGSDQFQNWINSNNGKIFLTGIPGAGKTILFATVVEEIFKHIHQRGRGSALAYHFCDYKERSSYDPTSILGSLVAQLAAQDQACFSCAHSLYQDHHPDEGLESPYTTEGLRECLVEMMESLEHAYIAVDALDECTVNRASFLGLLHSLNDFPNDTIKTLYTGREDLDIQNALHDYDRVPIAANSHDLRLYVDAEIAARTKNGTLRIQNPALKEEIRERLVKKAEGM